jgi:hypothetical protein
MRYFKDQMMKPKFCVRLSTHSTCIGFFFLFPSPFCIYLGPQDCVSIYGKWACVICTPSRPQNLAVKNHFILTSRCYQKDIFVIPNEQIFFYQFVSLHLTLHFSPEINVCETCLLSVRPLRLTIYWFEWWGGERISNLWIQSFWFCK